ncbi:MAG: sensor histidine kinase [Porticoccaceae bacterium]|nr:MAG: sensor histidine kinase [Porticoccaceae bacterium]
MDRAEAPLNARLAAFGWLRLPPLLAAAGGVAWLYHRGAGLDWPLLALNLALLAAAVALAWVRARWAAALGEGELACHLAADLLLWAGLMYQVGGAGNPFAAYLLVPVAFAAVAVGRARAALLTALAVGLYGWLLAHHVPLPLLAPGATHGGGIHPHLWGMALNFAASSILVVVFVGGLAHTAARQRRALERLERARLEDEQLLAVAAVAAGAAHELATPINTLALLVEELRARPGTGEDPDLTLMAEQVERCRGVLAELARTARQATAGAPRRTPARAFFAELVEQWRRRRPEVPLELGLSGPQEAELCCHPTLVSSLHWLLDNAAEASPAGIEVSARWDGEGAELVIRDQGPGPAARVPGAAPVASAKRGGLGLGLFLARRILAHHGARLTWGPAPGGGTLTRVYLPAVPAHGP